MYYSYREIKENIEATILNIKDKVNKKDLDIFIKS